MTALLDAIATGHPVRVSLVAGQCGRDVRVAISRAAVTRGLFGETRAGEGVVAVRKAETPAIRTVGPAAFEPGKRRGRPSKHQEQDAAAMASLQDLAAGES